MTSCRRQKVHAAPGAALVAAVIFRIIGEPSRGPGGGLRDQSWLGSAMALRLLAGTSPCEVDRTLSVDPATRIAALRGHQLMFDVRRDGGTESQHWILDLDGFAVAVLLEQRAIASLEWARRGHPQTDQALYEDVGARLY